MKKNKEPKSKGLKKEDYPKTFNLLKDLEELLNESNEEYPQW
jgi:hypothetical protein